MKPFIAAFVVVTFAIVTMKGQQNYITYECQDPPLYSLGSDLYSKFPSLGMQLAEMILGATLNSNSTEDEGIDFDDVFMELAKWIVDFKVQTDVQFTRETIGGIETIVFAPKNLKNDHVLLYAHGGAFVNELILMQWDMMIDVAKIAGSKVYIPLYTLADKAQFPTQINELDAVYDYILRENPNSKIILIGDSAGGNLVLALTSKLIDSNQAVPDRLIVISPWVDLEMDNPEIPFYQERDVSLNAESLIQDAMMYLGEGNEWLLDDPLASPLFADLDNFPPVLYFTGTNDIFYPDAVLFKDKTENAGVDINFVVVEGGFHVFPAGPKFLMPEAVKSRRQMASYINCHNSFERDQILTNNNEKNGNNSVFDFDVYPNPMTTLINVRFDNQAKMDADDFVLKVTNIFGQQLYTSKIFPGTTEINIGHILRNSGVYYIQLESSDYKNFNMKKIIKY